MKIQVEVKRKPQGVWEMTWQIPGDRIQSITANSANHVAALLLRIGEFEFVRGLKVTME